MRDSSRQRVVAFYPSPAGATESGLPIETWARFIGWLAIGLVIYFFYSKSHSRLQQGVDTGDTEDIVPPIVKP